MQALIIENPAVPIVVPVSLVAQIVSRDQFMETRRSINFIMSEIPWREFQVPLISSCQMVGAERSLDDDFQRAVIIWPMKGGKNVDFFAFSAHGAPRVVEVENQLNATELDSGPVAQYALGACKLDDQTAIIPDLSKISSVIFNRN